MSSRWPRGSRVQCYGRPWLGVGVVVEEDGHHHRCAIVAWPDAETATTGGVLHGVHYPSELRREGYRPRQPARGVRPTLYWVAPLAQDPDASISNGRGEEDTNG